MNQKDRNGSGATPRRKFDEIYKRHAVELTLHGDRSVKTIAKADPKPQNMTLLITPPVCNRLTVSPYNRFTEPGAPIERLKT